MTYFQNGPFSSHRAVLEIAIWTLELKFSFQLLYAAIAREHHKEKTLPDHPFRFPSMVWMSSVTADTPWKTNVEAIKSELWASQASLVAQTVKNPPAVQETQVWSLGQEDPLEEGIATHSSILAWRIPWTEESGGFSPWGRKESDTTERLTLPPFTWASQVAPVVKNRPANAGDSKRHGVNPWLKSKASDTT